MRLLEFTIDIMEVIGTCKDFAIFGGWRRSSDERRRCGENGRVGSSDVRRRFFGIGTSRRTLGGTIEKMAKSVEVPIGSMIIEFSISYLFEFKFQSQ